MSDHSTTELLKSLEGLYLKGNYQGAKELLLQNKSKMDEGHFHYNMGTLYSKLKYNAAGRYHFEKAIHSGFVNTEVLNNLQVVNSRLALRDLSNSKRVSDRSMNVALDIPPAIYLGVTLSLVLLTLVMVKMRGVRNATALVFVFIIALLPVSISQFYLEKKDYAITLEATTLYEGPSKVYEQKMIIPAGSKFVIGEIKEAGWFFIERPLELSGWVLKDTLGIY
jgi:hypothetical protein